MGDLTEVVRFHATRDATPERWAPSDRTNINTDPPFGASPALTEPEIADVVAFLHTLDDGYAP
jgi:cytochrome c peroxidase